MKNEEIEEQQKPTLTIEELRDWLTKVELALGDDVGLEAVSFSYGKVVINREAAKYEFEPGY